MSTDGFVAPRVVHVQPTLISDPHEGIAAGVAYAQERYGVLTPETVDWADTTCRLQSNGCSHAMSGHGGYDSHHSWPKSMGGPEDQAEEALCPNHHARQHALLRYMVECVLGTPSQPPSYMVLRHYTPPEILMAEYALSMWEQANRPHIAGWSRPAAR